jgi:hypothetical protein
MPGARPGMSAIFPGMPAIFRVQSLQIESIVGLTYLEHDLLEKRYPLFQIIL